MTVSSVKAKVEMRKSVRLTGLWAWWSFTLYSTLRLCLLRTKGAQIKYLQTMGRPEYFCNLLTWGSQNTIPFFFFFFLNVKNNKKNTVSCGKCVVDVRGQRKKQTGWRPQKGVRACLHTCKNKLTSHFLRSSARCT